jgi:hypothetical protein
MREFFSFWWLCIRRAAKGNTAFANDWQWLIGYPITAAGLWLLAYFYAELSGKVEVTLATGALGVLAAAFLAFISDIVRVNQIRNLPEIIDRAAAGFTDSSLWEEAKSKSDDNVKRLIDNALHGTSVTVVCVGSQKPGEFAVELRPGRNPVGDAIVLATNFLPTNQRLDVGVRTPFVDGVRYFAGIDYGDET